ncbi:MAG: cell division protein [Candidatus Marinimicrobia bacterium]|nr:cell division protein [Candidatus Neomarinimicrobiota bacterium]
MMIKHFEHFDKQLIIITLILLSVGSIMLFSASSHYANETFGNHTYFFNKHILRILIGIILMFFLSIFDYKNLKYISTILLIFSFLIVMIAHFTSDSKTSRWLIVGGKTLFTTSDLSRMTLVIFTSYYLEKSYRYIKDFKRGFLPIITIIGINLLAIVLQPDLSTSLTIGMILSILLFIGGVRLKHLIILVCTTLPFILFYIWLQKGYQWQRIINWLNPNHHLDAGNYQSSQALLGLGNGGLLGQGLGNSIIKFPGLLPEIQTDFIFSVIGEELGFFGIILILFLFVWLFFKGMLIAKNASDAFGMYLAIGIVLNIKLYVLINISYVVGFLPTTGLPLPFFSYGGSNIIITLMSIGILNNISMKNKFSNIKRTIF